MGRHQTYLSYNFSPDEVTAKFEIRISGGDEGVLLYALNQCLRKWSRQAYHHGGPRPSYCIELGSKDSKPGNN